MREECGIRSHAPTELNQRVSPDEDIVSDGRLTSTAVRHNSLVLPYTPHSSEGSDGASGGPAPNLPTPDNLFDWGNVDVVWRDVDTMMTEFGFHVDEL
jgi:hypothetical protein